MALLIEELIRNVEREGPCNSFSDRRLDRTLTGQAGFVHTLHLSATSTQTSGGGIGCTY